MAPQTLIELLQERARATPEREAYRQFEPLTRRWVSYSWRDIQARVQGWQAALQAESLPPGARVAILLPNSIEHVCMDQAALAAGLVPVPLHVIDNPESLAFIISDCGASLLLVDTLGRWSALASFRDRLPELRRVVHVQGAAEATAPAIASPLDDWLRRAAGDSAAVRPVSVQPDSLAAIVYTSGTTGRPKGVMLSHRNVVSNIDSIMAAVRVREEDLFLSFLPLSHTFERTVGYYLPIAAGATVAFARSVPLLAEDLRVVRPTILVSVPRIYERAHAAITEAVNAHWPKKLLFELTVRLGWRRFEHAQHRAPRPSLPARAIFPLLDHLVARAVRARFGGRLRAAVSGGAAMPGQVARPLLALGLPLLQGYGMTESAPVIACNLPEDNDPSSVGRPVAGVEVRIGDQDELLARGANVMLGYWRRPEETARAKDPEGWLHTGDQARITDGRIHIKGRLKDIIVTSTGEKIAPADLEAAIAMDPAFDQVMILGENRPYLVALVVLNRESWNREAPKLGLDATSGSDLRSDRAISWALERIASASRSFPRYATPRAVYLSIEPWTVASGLITPTLKPKRAALEAHYAREVAELYRGH